MKTDNTTKRERFLEGYQGREMRKKYPNLNVSGTWAVHGEDPNCDMGGSHIEPLLGHFSGKLSDVIDIAVALSGFWNWGAGGSIREVLIQKVNANTMEIRNAIDSKKFAIEVLQKEIKELEARL